MSTAEAYLIDVIQINRDRSPRLHADLPSAFLFGPIDIEREDAKCLCIRYVSGIRIRNVGLFKNNVKSGYVH